MLPAGSRPSAGAGYRSAMAVWDLTPKPVDASQVTLVQLMEITDANLAGIVHGGVVMKLVDTAAGLAAIKHVGGLVVTVSMDEMSFLAPVHIGDTITVKASVNEAYTTSLEVGVTVESERILTSETAHASSAYLVFVALDEDGKPRPVPPLVAETALQQRRQREARLRREARMAHRESIAEHRRAVRAPAPEPPTPPPAPRSRRRRTAEPPDEDGGPKHLRI
jgi:acyl-CoA hydrolase